MLVIAGKGNNKKVTLAYFDALQNKIKLYSTIISKNKNNASDYLLRANANFMQHNIFAAIEDYDRAIALSNLDKAYLGRGMVKGRMGFIEDAISDLSVYIQRKPYDAFAYSKRGVRYICLGDILNAEKDLTKAIQLDPNNAQAHDDLGIIFANRGDNETAKEYFISSISLDPTYRKSYHNLAMVYLITGKNRLALHNIEQAVSLRPDSRNSILLKSEILNSLGRVNEATELIDIADFLPANNKPEGLPELIF